MTTQEALNLYNHLNSTKGLPGAKFSYAIAKNIRLLQPEIDALTAANKPSDEFIAYDEKRANLAKEYAKKDENGVPISLNDNYIIEDQTKFDTAFEELKSENQEVIDKRATQIEELREVLKTSVEINLHMLNLSEVPDSITTEQMTGIFPIIIE